MKLRTKLTIANLTLQTALCLWAWQRGCAWWVLLIILAVCNGVRIFLIEDLRT